jgi:hypothetical protein
MYLLAKFYLRGGGMNSSRKIGKYEILEKIGRGATAVVFKAREIETGRVVALKQLIDIPGSEAEFYESFINEGETAAKLKHKNIVQIYDFGDMEGTLCIAMELVGEGYSLREYLRESGELDLEETVSILSQVADALTYLHERELTHQDVKPANILMDRTAENMLIALADFGLVRSVDPMSFTKGTSSMLGTPTYMAPEQAEPPKWGKISPLTDVYALGIIAYEMLVGCPPFEGAAAKVLHLQAYENPPSPLKFAPELGSDLSAVILKALSKNPQQRYPSVADFVEALREVHEARTCRVLSYQRLAGIVERARAARENEDWLIVQECCVQAMHIDPADSEVLNMMDEATARLRRAGEEEAKQKHLARVYEEGEKSLAAGEWSEAVEQFKEVRSIDSEYREVRALLGEALIQSDALTQGGFQGSSVIQLEELHDLLEKAERRVRILGVVALDVDWKRLARRWCSRNTTDFSVEILCESDNMLFAKSFTHDTEMAENRLSYRTLKFRRDRALVDLPDLIATNVAESCAPTNFVDIGITYLNVPISIVQIDDRLFVNLWLHELERFYEEIESSHSWSSLIERYVEAYFDPKLGRKYVSKVGDEVLELFDHKRIPRGIYPRHSFYDTDYSQLVVWSFVFDRKGRMLIHRRARNAKDNRGMWDKSVGGHIDFHQDVGTARAASREVIEELFSDEVKLSQSDLAKWSVNDREMIYLGEWRPDHRGKAPFEEIARFRREWAFFRVSGSQYLYSPRMLPNGKTRRLRVIADVFLFVAGPHLDESTLGELKNSTFKLVEISELKNAMDLALRGETVSDFDREEPIPQFSPDLTNIMTSNLRDVLDEFSQYIKQYLG